MSTQDLPAPRLLALGDGAWTVEFGRIIDDTLNARVMGLAQRLAAARQTEATLAAVTDVVPSFRSLTVYFDPQTGDADAIGAQLLALSQHSGLQRQEGRHWRLPVCFDTDFAPDLQRLADARGLAPHAVMQRLLQARFRVYMIGFLPGFPYMGGLPPELAMPRLANPRQRVPANSLAVAGEMCAVYPWESPGGWNLLGRTPVPLFDPRHAGQPAMLAAGDQVQWYAVARDEYQRLQALAQAGQLPRERFLETGCTPCPA